MRFRSSAMVCLKPKSLQAAAEKVSFDTIVDKLMTILQTCMDFGQLKSHIKPIICSRKNTIALLNTFG